NVARQHVIEYLGVQADRVHTVYSGVDELFRALVESARLEAVRTRYHLPEQFFMYCGQIYPPKNFARLLRAYAQVGPRLGVPLVVVGAHSYLCEHELELIEKLDLTAWVIQPGWID